jgi:uncharacterized membrane protein HdeD (DUF308 family)
MRKFFQKDDFGLAALVAGATIVAMTFQAYSEQSTLAMGVLAVVVGVILLAVATD